MAHTALAHICDSFCSDPKHSLTPSTHTGIVQRSQVLGCVREGAHVDLLVINGNPMEDLSLLYDSNKGPDYIIKCGQIVVGP